MPVVYDTVSTSYGPATNPSWTHTPLLGNTLIVIGVGVQSSGVTVSSVTYGGLACTKLGQAVYNSRAEFWYRVNPPLGPQTVQVNLSTNSYYCASACSYYKVRTGNPFGTIATQAKPSANVSVDVTCEAGGMAIDCLHIYVGGSPTIGAGQTQQWGVRQATPDTWDYGSYEAGSGTVTMSWTWSGSCECSYIAAPINPGGMGSQVIWMMAKRMSDFMRDLRKGLVPPDVLQRRWGEVLRPI